MAGCYQPTSQRGMNETAREHLPPHVIGHAHDRRDGQHHPQHRQMDRHNEREQRHNNRSADRFDRVEAHRSPCGGRAAVMVDSMGKPEQAWIMVHRAVAPIKPAVLNKQIDEDRNRQIPKRVGRPINVKQRPIVMAPQPKDDACRCAVNECGDQRPSYLFGYLRLHPVIKAGPKPLCRPCEQATCEEITRSHNHRHRGAHHYQSEPDRRVSRDHAAGMAQNNYAEQCVLNWKTAAVQAGYRGPLFAVHSPPPKAPMCGSRRPACRRIAIRASRSTCTLRRAATSGSSGA